ncbi:acyl-CoA dehydrogenase [Pseudofrankia asymbiotica]|uniref:Acyl-CoA dehydrogenase n=1 Tax=Pseudofrankia asymbiotica TaxID=1834516 RepID=A0A1V2I8K3_9ACTN|nr:acyl-CoA dehydrogenase [Pseudofrankia asymbiotica]
MWPLPRAGRTRVRWSALAELAERDLVLARLVEAHADAVAILAELGGGPVRVGSRWGVWAAEGPGRPLAARPAQDGGWLLDGTKQWCSGATLLTHALVTARSTDGDRRLFAVALEAPGVSAGPDAWAAAGMKGADTRAVAFTGAPARAVGESGDYLSRPGFWAGGIGVAACWYGGAVAVAGPLRSAVAAGRDDPHAAAHLGAVDVALGACADVLRAAADQLDADRSGTDWSDTDRSVPDRSTDRPAATTAAATDHARLARRVRGTVAQAASDVIVRVGRALGPAPLAGDAEHARRVADLEVYIRQDHAERDLAALGADVAATHGDWSL